ncbi:MAG: hypothetical protein KGP14_07990 [Betaproteobacteria bacterium]|nr:hypothetical protein [Betaproteobacteria bacterium]
MLVLQSASAVDIARVRRNFFAPASDRYLDLGKLCQNKTLVVLIGAFGCGRVLPEKLPVRTWGAKLWC